MQKKKNELVFFDYSNLDNSEKLVMSNSEKGTGPKTLDQLSKLTER